MAKRPSTIFVCQECGAQSAKWLGRCADCGAWNSFVEERAPEASSGASSPHRYAVAGAAGAARLYSEIEIARYPRLTTGIDEFDRVLAAASCRARWCSWAASRASASTLRCRPRRRWRRRRARCSTAPAKSRNTRSPRGERLAVGDAPPYLLAETASNGSSRDCARGRRSSSSTCADGVFAEFQSAPGSIGQVREAATQLLFTAKAEHPDLSVGHVTKDGSLAGPKALEHVVDTVLYFEGERHHCTVSSAR